NSPLIRRFLSEPDALSKMEMFVKEVGLDPRHDISEVLLGGKEAGPGPGIFVRGGLFRGKLQAFISRKKDLQVETQTYKGLDILTPRAHGGQPSLVFFDDNLLGFGERRTLESVIDVHQGAASSLLNNSKMMGLLSTINQSDTIWLASTNGNGF